MLEPEVDLDELTVAAMAAVRDFEAKHGFEDAAGPARTEVYLPDWVWAKFGEEKIQERAAAGMFIAKRYPKYDDDV